MTRGFRALQNLLIGQPQAGAVIPGTGGFRKVRFADSRRGKGKRGGLRVIYYFFAAPEQIWLVTIYDKDEMQDLDSSEKKLLREMIAEERAARQGRLR